MRRNASGNMLLLISRTCFVTACLGPPIKYVGNIEGENGSKFEKKKRLLTLGGECLKPEKNINIFYGGSINLQKYGFFAIFSPGQVCFSKRFKGNSSCAENWIEDHSKVDHY